MGIIANITLSPEMAEKLAEAKAAAASAVGQYVDKIQQSSIAKNVMVAVNTARLFENYEHIKDHPHEAQTANQIALDAVTQNGVSLHQLRTTVSIPDLASGNSVPENGKDTYHPREDKQVASDALVDTVLTSLTNKTMPVEDVLNYFNKKDGQGPVVNDNVAFNKDHSVVAIRDPYSDSVRAFKVVMHHEDFHNKEMGTKKDTGGADSTGFAGIAVAEIKVNDATRSPKAFIESHDRPNQPFIYKQDEAGKYKVREIMQGFQVSYDGCPQSGQLDRGEAPAQLSRVLDFNKQMQTEMIKEGFKPGNTEIDITSHSLGVSNALLSRYYWENNPELKGYSIGHTTAIEPVAESGAVKEVATMIAGAKIVAGRKANIETEIASLTNNLDIVDNKNSSYAHKFQVGDSKMNNVEIGTRKYLIPEAPLDPVFVMAKAKITTMGAEIQAVGEGAAVGLSTAPLGGGVLSIAAEKIANYVSLGVTGKANEVLQTGAALWDHLADSTALHLIQDKDKVGVVRDNNPNFTTPRELAGDHSHQEKNLKDKAIQTASYAMLSYFQTTDPTEFDRVVARVDPSHQPAAKLLKDIGETVGDKPQEVKQLVAGAQVPAVTPKANSDALLIAAVHTGNSR